MMTFNLLPLEIHLAIFSHLPLRKLMRIRQVCKQWRHVIDVEIKFKRLRCSQIHWRFENDYELSDSYDFQFRSLKRFLDQASHRFGREVKCLFAFMRPSYAGLQDVFDFLNSFKSLEKTQFICLVSKVPEDRHEDVRGKTFTVNLDRLEKALIDFDHMPSQTSVVLNLPRLLILSINFLKTFTILHPAKLRILSTFQLFGQDVDYSKFTSLTKIYTNPRDVQSISAGFLKSLPSLSELHFDQWGYIQFEENHHQNLPGRSYTPFDENVKIFYFGFQVSLRQILREGEQFPDFISIFNPPDQTSRFMVRNLYRSIDNNPHVEGIHYNPMASELNDTEMFDVMFQKFPKITYLKISGNVADENRLLKFIDRFKISYLAFERTSMPISFFEKLAEKRSFIRTVELKTEPTMNILAGDFDFIFKFENLYYVSFVGCPLSLNFVARLLKEFNSKCSIGFSQPGNYKFHLGVSDWRTGIELWVHGSASFIYKISGEEALCVVKELKNWFNTDAYVCPKELQNLLRHLEFERENTLFWMRKCLYDHRHSICLSEEQMGLLNFARF